MNRDRVSHVPSISGVKHPFTAMLREMVGNSKELLNMKAAIIAKSKGLKITPNLYDRNALMQMEGMSDMKDRFKAIMREALKKETYTPLIEHVRPPPSNELYGRLLKGKMGYKVMDVGSGNGKRLLRVAAHLDLRTCDKEVAETVLSAPHFHMCLAQVPSREGEIFTSFNVVSQDPSILGAGEGIHIFPDVDYFMKCGLTVPLDNGLYKTTTQNDVYLDYKVCVPSVDLIGYRGTNVFNSVDVDVELQLCEAVRAPFGNIGERVTSSSVVHTFMEGDLTVKYDGELLKLSFEKGLVFGEFRDGSVCVGRSNSDLDMSIFVEALEDSFVLLKVECYRGFEPFHSTELLDYFTRTVRIVINGCSLGSPKPFDPGLSGIEGLVCRIRGKDLLISCFPSFDLEPVSDVERLFREAASQPIRGCVMREGVNEYVLVKRDGVHCLVWKKRRKKKEGDSKEKIRLILNRPCLQDYEEIYPLARSVCELVRKEM